jgi:hypothetical protein
VIGTLNGVPQTAVPLSALPVNSWRQINVSLSALGVADQPNFDGLWLQAQGSSPVPTFYVDDISLVSAPVTSGTNSPVAISVDAQANRHPISPLIYGTAFATSNQLSDLNFTISHDYNSHDWLDAEAWSESHAAFQLFHREIRSTNRQ